MFIWIAPESAKVADTAEVAPGIILDYDESGRVIGIEVLDLQSRIHRETPIAAE